MYSFFFCVNTFIYRIFLFIHYKFRFRKSFCVLQLQHMYIASRIKQQNNIFSILHEQRAPLHLPNHPTQISGNSLSGNK